MWYKNGQKESEATYKVIEITDKDSGNTYLKSVRDGNRTCWFEGGQKELEGFYKDGKQNGTYIVWYVNGDTKLEKQFKEGVLLKEKFYWLNFLKSLIRGG